MYCSCYTELSKSLTKELQWLIVKIVWRGFLAPISVDERPKWEEKKMQYQIYPH